MPDATTCPSTADATTRAVMPAARYPSPVIALHWLTLVLLIAVYALIELKGFFPKGSAVREGMKSWHELSGIMVFLVVLLRLVWRRAYPRIPSIMPPPPPWQEMAAHAMHWALYAFLVAMPLLGWLVLSAKGHPDLPLGLHLPSLVAPDKQFARSLQDVHETIGTIGYYLIGLHAAAALFHHYWMRDNTLRRMLP